MRRNVDRFQFPAAQKQIVRYNGQIFRQMHGFQTSAAVECTGAEPNIMIGQHQRCKTAVITCKGKSILADFRDRIRNDKLFQIGCVFKCAFSDIFQMRRQIKILTLKMTECIFSDARQRIRKRDRNSFPSPEPCIIADFRDAFFNDNCFVDLPVSAQRRIGYIAVGIGFSGAGKRQYAF